MIGNESRCFEVATTLVMMKPEAVVASLPVYPRDKLWLCPHHARVIAEEGDYIILGDPNAALPYPCNWGR
jgi:hypothetical protein